MLNTAFSTYKYRRADDSKQKVIHSQVTPIVNQNIGVSYKENLHSDPINTYLEVAGVQLGTSYTIPVSNKFQTLDDVWGRQVSTIHGDNDICGNTQHGSGKSLQTPAIPCELNNQPTPSVSHSLIETS